MSHILYYTIYEAKNIIESTTLYVDRKQQKYNQRK